MRNIILLFVVLISGCMELPQIEWLSSNEEIRISPGRTEIDITLLNESPKLAQEIVYDEVRSFAISPNGERLKLKFSANEYAMNDSKVNNYPWSSHSAKLIRVKDGIEEAVRWEDGEWEINLLFSGENAHETVKSKFRLWTFDYNPLIHGPPN